MDTLVGRIDREDIDDNILKKGGDIIRAGGLVAFPTETVYGLGGDALNPASSRKIYEAKGRPSDNPLIVHIADIGALARIASMKDEDYSIPGIYDKVVRLADSFWPGPLTIILKKTDAVPYETTGGLDTVAVRMPSDPIALGLISASGGYIAAPSANISGRPSPTRINHVIEDMDGRIDMILDGGDVDIGVESTIVDLTEDRPVILRPGAVTADDLGTILGKVYTDPALAGDTDKAPKAPGMKYRHYAPKADLTIVKGDSDKVMAYINEQAAINKSNLLKTGVICVNEHLLDYTATSVKCVGRSDDRALTAHKLYAILREFDDEDMDIIYSEAFDPDGIGQAVMNRLTKAAGHKIIEL
ncbi:MAG: threonylcarbamoyl-AMP synthase [Lachnospiraceae bacterium]|nr:threonylcarbamoyl-AMP synthase [Lachnospiraceae bacterium]